LQQALGHELPNQLVAVQGMARLLQLEAGDRLGADGSEYVHRLAAAAQRAHETVRALAGFVRALRADAVGRVSLADVVREAAAELGGLCKALAIEYHLPEQGPFLCLPPIVVRQVVASLLRHAAEDASKRLVLETREEANTVELRVSADGPGPSAEEMQRLLVPFACRDRPGAALGLVLAKQLIENWGGTLAVESEGGRGTMLKVMFPRGVAPSPTS
jgi:signal transduction histidine kinase